MSGRGAAGPLPHEAELGRLSGGISGRPPVTLGPHTRGSKAGGQRLANDGLPANAACHLFYKYSVSGTQSICIMSVAAFMLQ